MKTQSLYKTAAGEKMVMDIYDTALNNWPVAYETHQLATRYGDTFVIASGQADLPAMVLLHGAGSNASIWAGDISDYSSRFRVYAVDLPGEAGKSAPIRPAWDSPAFAEWLEDVLNGLAIERAILIGISQGGWTALKFAVLRPQRVEQLVLMTPGGIVPDRQLFLFRAIGMMLLGKWGLRRLVHALFGDQTVPDGVIDIVIQISSQFKPRIGVLPIFSDDQLRQLTMPILLLGGTRDILRDLDKIAMRLRDLVPHLNVTIIPGAGHALLNTTSYVMTFLQRESSLEDTRCV